MTESLTIGGRIKLWRESLRLTQDEAATQLGIPFGTYQKYEMGLRALGAKAVGCFINVGVNPVWLINGDGAMLLNNQSARKPHDWNAVGLAAHEAPAAPYGEGDFVAIDKYVNVRGSAGPGTEVYEEAVVKVKVDARLLRERIGGNFGNIKIASVSGDSMEPTLSHGDQVLVDTSCQRFIDDAIYAIQQDGHLRFKRIQLKLDGSIVVKSDGSANTETYSGEEAQRFFVVGMVIPFKFGRFKI